ncbi:MAG: hypothetical protein CMC55_08810 [Flavobacteriaceae bacterium]|nr:hypothetical protein [Flavobacteriaceae bacterium]|tara:strand:- start:93 stop:662 length:570 start_codon:yes stop_codon:yes gene_type:complete
MNEIWKDILNYEEQYQVSNLGNIRSKDRIVNTKGNATRLIKGSVKKLCVNRKGYAITALSKPDTTLWTVTVHQLVAQAFIPNFIKGTEINHIDGNKLNNAVSNLEESNPSHNQLHAIRTGLRPKVSNSIYRNVTYVKNPRAVKRWAGSIRHDGKSTYGWKTFLTEEEAAKHVDALLDSIGDTDRLRNFP